MESSVGAIVLAAGMSERMNGAKLVSLLHGKPMIQYVTEAASHPLIVGASLFHAFFSLCSDSGGRMIIEENRDSRHVILFSSRLSGQDIDTPEQLQWMENHSFPLQKEEMTDG